MKIVKIAMGTPQYDEIAYVSERHDIFQVDNKADWSLWNVFDDHDMGAVDEWYRDGMDDVLALVKRYPRGTLLTWRWNDADYYSMLPFKKLIKLLRSAPRVEQ